MKFQNSKKHLGSLTEETVLFFSILKWIILASIIGCIVGISTAGFLWILEYCQSLASSFKFYYLALPFALCVSVLLVKYLSPDSEGHGTEKVIESIHKRSGHIRARVIPIKLVATIITITGGGSVGKEGPCAQIGGGLASLISNICSFKPQDRKKLVICGISAGFAAVFGTPIAGAIFGVEVLFVGALL